MPKKVVTLGEIMMRLSTPDYQRFIQCDEFDVTYGGGEANVAVALSNYGLETSFVSKVPDNPIGQAAINHLRRFGVDTRFVARGGNRLGIYFLESGASIRPSQVMYDRRNTAISEADIADFDFDSIFEDARWFHTTGITPALSEKAAALTEFALKTAQSKGITTSVDLNYRKSLWTVEDALETMGRLWQYVDVCIGGELNVDGSKEEALKYMKGKYGFKYVASSMREVHSAWDNGYLALAYDGNEFYHSKEYQIGIVDRVGSGDSFAGGFIYGLISGMSLGKATEFGAASAALKHTISGDFNHATLEEVLNLMNGDASGRIQR